MHGYVRLDIIILNESDESKLSDIAFRLHRAAVEALADTDSNVRVRTAVVGDDAVGEITPRE